MPTPAGVYILDTKHSNSSKQSPTEDLNNNNNNDHFDDNNSNSNVNSNVANYLNQAAKMNNNFNGKLIFYVKINEIYRKIL